MRLAIALAASLAFAAAPLVAQSPARPTQVPPPGIAVPEADAAELRAGLATLGKEVGGLDAKGAVVSAHTGDGTALRMLVAVASGKAHTYLVQVLTARGAPTRRLAEAQLALNTLRLRG